jgi:tetratricopeptide (TPR) repeat protein
MVKYMSFNPKKIALTLSCLVTVSFSGILPAFAGDPFRISSQNPRNIGEKTEKAFNAVFKDGNYILAEQYIKEAEITENYDPIVPALKGALAYLDKDWQTLHNYALKTIELAENIKKNDQVRGNLYLAVGNFLEGTYIFKTDSPIAAIPKVQQVFSYMDKAHDADPNDPELNLIKGYMDLNLSLYLPFSSPDQAITKLQNNAAPNYLVYRGIAVAYRNLNNLDKALEFANRSLNLTPNNPEALYLKGQIIRKQGIDGNSVSLLQQALPYLTQAYEQKDQLPVMISSDLERETRNTCNQINQILGRTECTLE